MHEMLPLLMVVDLIGQASKVLYMSLLAIWRKSLHSISLVVSKVSMATGMTTVSANTDMWVGGNFFSTACCEKDQSAIFQETISRWCKRMNVSCSRSGSDPGIYEGEVKVGECNVSLSLITLECGGQGDWSNVSRQCKICVVIDC